RDCHRSPGAPEADGWLRPGHAWMSIFYAYVRLAAQMAASFVHVYLIGNGCSHQADAAEIGGTNLDGLCPVWVLSGAENARGPVRRGSARGRGSGDGPGRAG